MATKEGAKTRGVPRKRSINPQTLVNTLPVPAAPSLPQKVDLREALDDAELLLAESYLQTLNISAAGTAASMERSHARKVLLRPNVRAYINDRLNAYAIGANEVLARISAFCGSVSMDDFMDELGNLDMAAAKKAGVLYFMRKYKVDKFGAEAIELFNPLDALEMMARVHNLLKNGEGGGPGADEGKGDKIENTFVTQVLVLTGRAPSGL